MSEMTRVAVVTGAAGGVGRAIVAGLREAGFRIAATDMRVPEPRRAERELWLPMDVRRMQTVEKAKDEILGAFGRVDVLVNNAGLFRKRQEILDLTLEGTLRCTAVFGAVMAQQKSGRVINIANRTAPTATSDSAHAGDKSSVIAATATLARELAAHGIRVNAVALGLAEEVAELVTFLATCAGDYLNGSVLKVDGGFSAG